jgi:hypothetical protein
VGRVLAGSFFLGGVTLAANLVSRLHWNGMREELGTSLRYGGE